MGVTICMIAAMAENGVIGNGGDIPWRLPSDFAHFKRTTMGKPLVMGRRTFESIGRPLPGRTTLVVSRRAGYQPDGVIVIDDLDAAIDHAVSIAESDGAGEVMIAGGAEIYRQAMPRAERLYITHVAADVPGDAHFPQIDPDTWRLVDAPAVTPFDKDSTTYTVAVYERG